MGDSQRLTPEDQLRFAREQFENAQDLTLAVEEEFAVLDPETLELSNRFEDLQAAAQGTPQRGNMRVKICVRAECRPLFTFSTNGELAESASSSGR